MNYFSIDFSLNLSSKNTLFLDEISSKNYCEKTIISDSEFHSL